MRNSSTSFIRATSNHKSFNLEKKSTQNFKKSTYVCFKLESSYSERAPLLRVEWGYAYKYFCTTSIYPNVVLIFPLILAFENGPYFATLSLSLSLSANVTATWYGSYKCTHNTNGLLKFVNAYKLKALLPDFRPHMTDSKRISSDIN